MSYFAEDPSVSFNNTWNPLKDPWLSPHPTAPQPKANAQFRNTCINMWLMLRLHVCVRGSSFTARYCHGGQVFFTWSREGGWRGMKGWPRSQHPRAQRRRRVKPHPAAHTFCRGVRLSDLIYSIQRGRKSGATDSQECVGLCVRFSCRQRAFFEKKKKKSWVSEKLVVNGAAPFEFFFVLVTF